MNRSVGARRAVAHEGRPRPGHDVRGQEGDSFKVGYTKREVRVAP